MAQHASCPPFAESTGLKNTLEKRAVPFMDVHIGPDLKPRRAMLTMGADRWGMSKSFLDGGYECVFGDLMFGLGLPIPVRSEAAVKRLAALVMPTAGRLPFEWLYPTGEKQEKNIPKFGGWYEWATGIAGDWHYGHRHLP